MGRRWPVADPASSAPLVVVDTTEVSDSWIFRAIDKRENVMYIIGADTRTNARRKAHVLLRENYLVEDPIRKEDRRWQV
jgi:hypothetical protein